MDDAVGLGVDLVKKELGDAWGQAHGDGFAERDVVTEDLLVLEIEAVSQQVVDVVAGQDVVYGRRARGGAEVGAGGKKSDFRHACIVTAIGCTPRTRLVLIGLGHKKNGAINMMPALGLLGENR